MIARIVGNKLLADLVLDDSSFRTPNGNLGGDIMESYDQLGRLFDLVRTVDETKCSPAEVQHVKVQFMEAILAVQKAINPLVAVVQVAVDDNERKVFREAGLAAIA